MKYHTTQNDIQQREYLMNSGNLGDVDAVFQSF